VLGRDIFGVLLGTGPERVLYAAAFHAQEWITSLLLLRFCEDLCETQTNLNRRSLMFVPQMNPDGVEIALHGPKAAGPYTEAVATLGGDRPGLWQANARGVDLNHNYDAGRAALARRERAAGIIGPAPRRWRGPAAHSEPETRALVSLCNRSHFRHVVAMHTQGEEIYWEYGPNTPPWAKKMAEDMAAVSGYVVAKPEIMASHGGFKDWFIETTEHPGFTVEFGKGVNPLPLADFENIYEKTRKMMFLSAFM